MSEVLVLLDFHGEYQIMHLKGRSLYVVCVAVFLLAIYTNS